MTQESAIAERKTSNASAIAAVLHVASRCAKVSTGRIVSQSTSNHGEAC
jgi:hypothetical protein